MKWCDVNASSTASSRHSDHDDDFSLRGLTWGDLAALGAALVGFLLFAVALILGGGK